MKPIKNGPELHIAAIMFDLDGVLVDSSLVVERHWTSWAARKQVPVEHLRPFMHGHRTFDVVQRFSPGPHATQEAEELEAREGADCEGLREVLGARRVIESLSPTSWGIVTSSSRLTAHLRLNAVGFQVPSALVTADDVINGKPSPEGYASCAKLLQVDVLDCLVIEDTPAGIKAGHSAGARVLAVATTHAHEELLKADLVVPDLRYIRFEGHQPRMQQRLGYTIHIAAP